MNNVYPLHTNIDRIPPAMAVLVPLLAEALDRLASDDHLIIDVAGTSRYVQFAAFELGLRAESTDNRYLGAGEQLTYEQVSWLVDHGWCPPDESGNFWRHWEPADPYQAAIVAVCTMHKVHGVTDPRELAFSSDDDDVVAPLADLTPPGLAGQPVGTQLVAVVDFIARSAVLELLAIGEGDNIYCRHAGAWQPDPEWAEVLPTAPDHSLVELTDQQIARVLSQVDRATAKKPFRPFKPSLVQMYWPQVRLVADP